jgi:hypothetical protein
MRGGEPFKTLGAISVPFSRSLLLSPSGYSFGSRVKWVDRVKWGSNYAFRREE